MAQQRTRRRSPWHRLWHWLRPRVSRPLARLALRCLPALQILYLRCVFATSRVDSSALAPARRWAEARGGLVSLFWHEEIYALPYLCGRAGLRATALVGHGDAGDLVAALLERCGHVVIRGGASRRASRRSPALVHHLIAAMRSSPGAILALAVDGTRGPAHQMKLGGLMVARECGIPIALVRIWYRHSLRLPTWDRLAIPLPWNEIRCWVDGPHFAPEDAQQDAGLERWRVELERRLAELAAHSYSSFGASPPESLARIVRCSRVE